MAKAAQRVREDGAGPGVRSPKYVGRQLRHVRRKQGLSRSEVARSAGLTRRELAAYERGRVEIPDSDLWCLAGSCGVDVAELLPHRDELRIDSDLSSLAIGDSIRHLREPNEPDGLLREYLAMIYELRNLPPGSAIPLRESDLATLADALGGAPEAIENRLVELIGVNREEAARLRAMIAPPLALDAGAPSTLSTFDTASPELYGEAIHSEPTPLLDAFLDAPRAEDPFSDPPPLAPAAPFLDVTAPHAALDPIAGLHVDPFAPMAAPDEAEAGPDGWEAGAESTRDGDVAEAWPDGREDVDVEPLTLDVPPTTDAWTPEDPDPLSTVVDALATLRDDPFAPTTAPAEPAMRLTDPDPDGIVIDVPHPMPPLRDETLAPIPERDPWVTTEIDEETPITPIVWHAATMSATDATTGPIADPWPADTESSMRLKHAGSGWQVGGMFPATAMADDGVLSLQRADTRWALSDLTAPGDVTAEAVVDFTGGAGFGILFHAGLDDSGALYGYSFDVDAIAGGGAYVVRQWDDNRPHWRPLAQAQALDPTRLLGQRTISLAVTGDEVTVRVDGETVLTVPSLSNASMELGRQPCRGDRLGIQAAATAEVTVSRLSAAQH